MMRVTKEALREKAEIAAMEIHASRIALIGPGIITKYRIVARFGSDARIKRQLADNLTAREAMAYLDGLIEGATREGMHREGFSQ